MHDRIVDDALCVKDDSGRTVLQVALIATVYFENAFMREVRERIATCCKLYFDLCQNQLRWALHPVERLMDSFGESEASRPDAWLPAVPEDESFQLLYHGADDERGASAYLVESIGLPRAPFAELGYMKFAFPLLWFSDHGGTFSGFVRDICQRLRPVSGYGGVGIVESPDTYISEKFEPVVFQWAQRFPGLEVDYPTSHSIALGQGRNGQAGIKGCNWTTVICDRFLDEMGGRGAVRSAISGLDARYIVYEYDDGIIIQAGGHPVLGDTERDSWPELYVKLAKYLMPIRIFQHRPFQYDGPEERFDLSRSQEWLRRFDHR